MQLKKAQFETSAPSLAACPEPSLPEFAFIGRSNVGKSSLLNLLAGRKNLAHVSATPGHTKLINFFRVDDAWYLVDLPGYGYAKVAREDRSKFSAFVADYLTKRESLELVFLLIDSRHEPQRLDLEFVDWLADAEVPFLVVFTKSDAVSKTKLALHMKLFRAEMAARFERVPEMFSSSATAHEGRSALLKLIGSVVRIDR
ncbi:MAG: YihA family ribosome biogenesis GTP-binding protein [Verrucomicrobia bacterium]|nr:YihA family ribosome biogenesis GTP-binding protein [Verrucomicrobiota bacterium]